MNWALTWAIWAIATGGSFGVLETIALIDRRRNDTLSENTRKWLGIEPVRPVRRVAVPVFAAVSLLCRLGRHAWRASRMTSLLPDSAPLELRACQPERGWTVHRCIRCGRAEEFRRG